MRMGKWLAILVLVPACGLTQETAPAEPDNARAMYAGSDELPDSVAFFSIMTMLDSMNQIENAAPALNVIQRGMGLTPAEAQDTLDRILLTYKAFSAERNAHTKELLCASDGTAPVGPKIYEAFEAMDDSIERLGNKYLLALKAELGADKANRFQQWIQSEKRSITYVKTRHKDEYERAGLSPDVTRDKICSDLARSEGG